MDIAGGFATNARAKGSSNPIDVKKMKLHKPVKRTEGIFPILYWTTSRPVQSWNG